MTGRRARLWLICTLSSALLGWFAPQAAAHRLNLSTTEIEWRAESQTLDVIHKLHNDDALVLLSRLGAGDGVLDLESSARLLNYVNRHFSLVTRDGPLALEPYGAHLQGNTLFIYQRAELAAPPPALEVRMRLLHDVVDQMRNDVHWRVADNVRSAVHDADHPTAWLTLQKTR